MSKKRKLRDTKKSLKQLKAKRANYAVGGYGYGGGSSSSKERPVRMVPIKEERDTASQASSNSRTGYGNTRGTATPQVMTRGEDGNMYPNPAAAAAANETYRASQASSNSRPPLPTSRGTGNPNNTTSNIFEGVDLSGFFSQNSQTSKAPVGMPIYDPGSPNLKQMQAVKTGIGAASTGSIESLKRAAGYGNQRAVEALRGYGISTDIQRLSNMKDIQAKAVSAGELIAAQGEAAQADVAGVASQADQYADKYVEQYPEWNSQQKAEAKQWAYNQRTGVKSPMPSWLMNSDFLKGIEAANNMEYDTTSREATSYEAAKAERLADTEAAQGEVSVTAEAGQAKAATVDTAQRDKAAEEAAMGVAATRPEERDYATAVTTDERFTVDQPEDIDVTTREAQVISQEEMDRLSQIAQERGVDVRDIPEYELAQTRQVQVGQAAQMGYTPRLGETPEAVVVRAETYGADFTPQGGKTEIDAIPAYIKASERTAQVGEASQRIAAELGNVPSTDLEGRQAITGEAPKGDAAQIGGIPTMAAATMQAVTGQERTVAAADMMEVIADVPPEVTAAVAQDPAAVEAQIDSGEDPKVTAAVAALPTEALVSTQMEGLLAGMEDGETPAWARPAVAAIESQMARRGLSASSVGRDALFNAIIQSALPMAQSNAQALQARAQQNLSNEQQANLASAQNTMQVRMQNLANRQTAASQTAEMAQQIKVQQGAFEQQAVMTTAQQAQETALANAQMAQQRAQQESSQRQQAAISQLSTNSQLDLANLQALNAAGAQNLNAEQQAKLQTYNAQVNRIVRQADLNQDMEKANLSPALQVEMQRISEINAAAKDTMTAEQTERLTNLQALIDFRKTDASFAQQMDMANMSNEQQMELAMLQDRAATDSANFTADNQFRLQELNNIVSRSTRQAELNARMEEVNLDASLKVELSELAEKNTTSRANMTAEQQTRLANLNVLVDFRKTNAAMAQQMDTANLANEQQMELANLQERSATDAANFTESNRFRMQELNTHVQVMSQNEQLKQNADMAKLSMQEKISLANLTQKNAADSESMSAENVAELQMYEKKMAAGQVNAQLAQQMGLANLSNEQSAAMFNAQMNANLDMKQFDADQQMALANSQFMQTMTATQFSADQQAAIQNATMLTQVDLANADARTRVSVENAKNFLTMDMANLSNEQQGIVMDQQIEQQALLSDQAAENARRQFGATSQNQLDQFMINQANNMAQFNTSATNAMRSFNVTESNRMAAIEAGNILQADLFTAQLEADINKFNTSIDTQRDQWNATNAQAVEQSNIQWRRQANTADTAAANAANQQNVQNAYNISALDQTQMWQQLRDEAAYIRQSYENNEQREAQLIATAIGNESGAAKDATTSTASLLSLISQYT